MMTKMAILPSLSGDVIMMFLFLVRFVRAVMYFLGRFCVDVLWFVVDAIKPCKQQQQVDRYWTHQSHSKPFNLLKLWIKSPKIRSKICNITQKTWTTWHRKHKPQTRWLGFQQRIHTRSAVLPFSMYILMDSTHFFSSLPLSLSHTHTHTYIYIYIYIYIRIYIYIYT